MPHALSMEWAEVETWTNELDVASREWAEVETWTNQLNLPTKQWTTAEMWSNYLLTDTITGYTFGYTSIGATTEVGYNVIKGSWFTCPEAGTAESISVYVRLYKGIGGPFRCALYKKSDNSFVAETEEIAAADIVSYSWHTCDFSSPKPSLQNGDYWIVNWSGGGLSNYIGLKSDEEAGKGCYTTTMTYNTFPDTLSLLPDDCKFSIYCTYTTGVVTEWGEVATWTNYIENTARTWKEVSEWTNTLGTAEIWREVTEWVNIIENTARTWKEVSEWTNSLTTAEIWVEVTTWTNYFGEQIPIVPIETLILGILLPFIVIFMPPLILMQEFGFGGFIIGLLLGSIIAMFVLDIGIGLLALLLITIVILWWKGE